MKYIQKAKPVRKVFKIILAIFAIIVILIVAFGVVAQIKNAVPALQTGGSLSNAIVIEIGESEDLDARAQDFVNQLIKG